MKQILLFVLFATLLCWLMFSPIYKHVVIMRQAILQQEVDYLLETGASGAKGCIDAAMLAEARQRLADRGFDSADVAFAVTTTSGVSGTNPAAPVLRGTGIKLVATYPYDRLFEIDRLVGIVPPPAGGRMQAAGMKMSEYVPQ